MRHFVLTCCLALSSLLLASTAWGFAIGFNSLVQSQLAPNVYTEQPVHPDAGDIDSPQNIQGTNITEIDGVIGVQGVVPFGAGPNLVCLADVVICCPNLPNFDCADAFRFSFNGGPVTFTGIELPGGTPLGAGPDIPLGIPLPLQLFSDPATSIISPDHIAPTCVAGFACFLIGFDNLPAGSYILRATEELADPPYIITISSGINGPGGTNGVPEPEQLALFAAALIGCIVVRRRSRAI